MEVAGGWRRDDKDRVWDNGLGNGLQGKAIIPHQIGRDYDYGCLHPGSSHLIILILISFGIGFLHLYIFLKSGVRDVEE